MIYEGYSITQANGYYSVTLGEKTFYRAKLTNLETIIHMYGKGGALRVRVMDNIPTQREEWISTKEEVILDTGKSVEVVTKSPVHPDAGHDFAFQKYSYVPEYGKGFEAVKKRATEAHEADYAQYKTSLLDKVIGVTEGGAKAIGGFKLPSVKLPSFGLPFKGVFLVVVLFVAAIVGLVALGYSGMGGAAGDVTSGEYKKRRG